MKEIHQTKKHQKKTFVCMFIHKSDMEMSVTYKQSVILLLLPCVLFLACILITAVLLLPKISDEQDGKHNAMNKIFNLLHNSQYEILLSLMFVHSLQVICCFPLLTITRSLYAFFLGFMRGFVICFVWEFALIFTFVIVATQNSATTAVHGGALQEFINFATQCKDPTKKYFHWHSFLYALHASSVPLVTGTSLVLFGITSQFEYVSSHAVMSAILCVKDSIFGVIMHQSKFFQGENQHSFIFFFLFIIIGIMQVIFPTVLTLTILKKIAQYDEEQKSNDIELHVKENLLTVETVEKEDVKIIAKQELIGTESKNENPLRELSDAEPVQSVTVQKSIEQPINQMRLFAGKMKAKMLESLKFAHAV